MAKEVLVLGIECTAHTIGASILNQKKKILSNINISMKSNDSGLIPVEIMEHHASELKNIIRKSLKEAKVRIEDISHIAISNAPGMGHALRVGNIMTKALSNHYNIPIIVVNHSLAHLTTGIYDFDREERITLLYAAGANTQLWNLRKDMLMLVGETLDMGLGHLMDLSARSIGYGFPGGPIIEEIALKHVGESIVELPYSVKGMDVSFGGVSTAFKNKYIKFKEKYDKKIITRREFEEEINLLCYSLQEHAFASMIEASERAMALQNSEGLSIIGGVALNKRFNEMARIMCADRNAILKIPKKELLADNAGMIALEGLRLLNSGTKTISYDKKQSLRINPYERLPSKMNYNRL